MTKEANTDRKRLRWTAVAATCLVAATAVACIPEVEPNDSNADATDKQPVQLQQERDSGCELCLQGNGDGQHR